VGTIQSSVYIGEVDGRSCILAGSRLGNGFLTRIDMLEKPVTACRTEISSRLIMRSTWFLRNGLTDDILQRRGFSETDIVGDGAV
jgi:hypothetical protein